ncbi:MAG TPA: choice-of-anchor R domain-containing protein [Verrucomicrobiae bacterium]|nr:choice-of-anchor R domain-containing protein [Verrucomicrobiae bacterium]
MKTIGIGLVFILVAKAAFAQLLTTNISNLNQPFAQFVEIDPNATAAFAFNTGNSSGYFQSLGLPVSSRFLPGMVKTTGTLVVSLCKDAGGQPGDTLGTLLPAGENDSGVTAIDLYTNSTTLGLATNTTYWIVAQNSGSLNVAFLLNGIAASTLDAGSTWTLGGLVSTSGNYVQFDIVTLSAPPISIFQPVVLTFTNFGYPYVLQQNTNLASTNWVNTTSAIQLSTVDTNQSVFIVPANAGQMFYRLSP